jgi:UDP-2-acetamido-3-amino-2,3-dideoxy-glucuronate N-acetyltransferase
MNPINFIDKRAIIGEGTSVWHFSVILAGVMIGRDCSIGSHAEIGRGTLIGDNTRIGHGVFLPPNSQVGESVFIGPCVVFTDDKHPRVNEPGTDYNAQPPVIGDGAAIGAGAVILPGVKIGKQARIGAGAIVTRDVADFEHVRGEPARAKALSDNARGW